MLIIGFEKIGKTYLADKYSSKVKELNEKDYKLNLEGLDNSEWPINFIEAIKTSEANYDVTLISFVPEVMACLDALNVSYVLCYPENRPEDSDIDVYNLFVQNGHEKLPIPSGKFIEDVLKDKFDWIELSSNNSLSVIEEADNCVVPNSAQNLTMEQLLQDDVIITESDIRELKSVQNKLRVGLLLQAKSNLNRVLKLSNVLDKLQDELVNRISDSVGTTDTPSLIYTTELISKLLADTNNFIISVLSNEKIQNFFIIDNVNVTNIHNDKVDVNEREKIRKVVEIVLNNIDLLEKGDFNDLKNPNTIEMPKEDIDVDTST